MSRLGIVGTTTWGTTLGVIAARSGHDATLFARNEAEASALATSRSHRFLPGVDFPDSLRITASLAEAFVDADLAIVAVPTRSLAANLAQVSARIAAVPLIVSATKGVEEGTHKRPTELIRESLPGGAPARVGVLSGPNLALEVARGMPTSATVAFDDIAHAERAQAILTTALYRVYASDDVIGVELGGALKNIVAIGAGVIDGLGLGDNGKSAFIARGLEEITRLGVALGARPETFAGLSGLGDLVATCYSELSRNHTVGVELARGRAVAGILEEMDQVAEGVYTTRAALALAAVKGIDMPITAITARVLDGLDPREAIELLMTRAPQPEVRR